MRTSKHSFRIGISLIREPTRPRLVQDCEIQGLANIVHNWNVDCGSTPIA